VEHASEAQLSERDNSRPEVAAGLILITISPLLPWFRFYAVGGGGTYGGIDGEFWGIAIPVWAFSVVLLVGGVVLKGERPRQVAQITALTGAIVSGCLIGACELMAALIPSAFLPESLRDALVDLRGSFGPWGALVGCLLVFFGLTGRNLRTYVRKFEGVFAPSQRKAAVAFAAVYLSALAVLWWVRHQPWLTVEAAGIESLPVWLSGTPFFGGVSLVAVALLVGAIVTWALGQSTAAVVLAGLGAWTFTFLAALFILAALGLAAVIPDDLTLRDAAQELGFPLPPGLGEAELDEPVTVTASIGSWLAYLLGLASALAAAMTVRLKARPWGAAV
jgi:hypothetical protein